jgi:enamine deaminase RidA (YjgF/YER057c/UK114 family)
MHGQVARVTDEDRGARQVKKELIAPKNHRGGAARSTSTQAVRVGDLIFVGGQMSLDDSGDVVGNDITTQATNAFEALKRVIESAGASMRDVLKHNVYFSCDGDDAAVAKFIDDLNKVRSKYFTDPGPTTTEVRCGLDRKGAMILIDAWAHVGGDRQLLSPPGHWSWGKKLPFSHGWRVGDLVFVGGQRSLDENGNVLGIGDIETQTDNSFRNLDTMLLAAGGDRTSLMRQNTYYRFSGQGREVTEYWEKMNRVRERWMSRPTGAGAGLRVTGMPDSRELIQVEGVGVLGTKNKLRLQPKNHWDWSNKGNQNTQGWQINNLAFIGGQISADASAKAVGKTLEEQTRNVYQFIRKVLAEAKLDESDVCKLYIYYHAPENWPQIDEESKTVDRVTREFYPLPGGPCETSFRVSGLAYEDLLVEIEAMAVTRE